MKTLRPLAALVLGSLMAVQIACMTGCGKVETTATPEDEQNFRNPNKTPPPAGPGASAPPAASTSGN